MAARNVTIATTAGVWTQLTDGDVTRIRVQSRSGINVALMATANSTPPSSAAGAFTLGAEYTLPADLELASLFPGVSAPVRLWALSDLPVTLSVSHD